MAITGTYKYLITIFKGRGFPSLVTGKAIIKDKMSYRH